MAMPFVFHTTKELETQIDGFLDAVSEGALLYRQALGSYLNNNLEKFEERLTALRGLENKADDLRRQVENHLYRHSLIPEHRGDVLGLLESMDNVIDMAKESLVILSVETPHVPEQWHAVYLELADMAVAAAEQCVLTARAFFRDVKSVGDYLHKVYFFEKEADKIAEQLKREIFASELELSEKFHMRNAVCHVDAVADMAEDSADRLRIYAIKRRP
jgi:predicted phosphate transport protein (TIGR00153 family)